VPIYEYKCLKNGHVFEVFHGISEASPDSCQICGEAIEKLVSSSSFHLKGTGWYVTDYKNQAKRSEQAELTENKNLASGKSDQSASVVSSEPKKEASTTKVENKTDKS
jgi:putative FmdB family regulatory protein